MKIEKCIKLSFAVIGKEGSTDDEADFIRNISYYDNATSYGNDFETYGDSYEPIEPITPSEQEIREENKRKRDEK